MRRLTVVIITGWERGIQESTDSTARMGIGNSKVCNENEFLRSVLRDVTAGGFNHHAALRALAYKWIRIMFRLWKTNTIYSEKAYHQRLVAKYSPLVKFLKTA